MRRLLDVMLMVLMLGLASHGQAQGLSWEQIVHAGSARMAVGGTGDLFVGSTNHGSGDLLFPVIDHFSPAGVLIHHAVANNAYGGTDSPSVVAVLAHGDNVKLFVTFTNFQGVKLSFVVNYTPSTGNITAFSDLGTLASSPMIAKSIVAGQDDYGVLAVRSSDSVPLLQRRKFSDDTIVNESTVLGSLQNVVHLAADEFAASSMIYANPNFYLRIYRLKDNAVSSTINLGSVPFTGAVCTRSADGSILWTESRKFEPQIYTMVLIPFHLTGNSFGASYPVGSSADLMEFDIQPFGATGVSSLYFESGFPRLATYDLTGLLFSKTVGGTQVSFGGLTRTDASGNVLTLVPKASNATYAMTLDRLNAVDGSAMNTMSVPPDINSTPVDAFVDAAGHIRALVLEKNVFESIYHVVQINPAGLTVAGTHTVGGDNATATVSLAEPAPAGGATFLLFSNSASAVVPLNVTIPEGETSQTFTINTSPVATNLNPTITARYSSLNVQATFSLVAPLIQSITATPQMVYGGNQIKATVTLTGNAPTGGRLVDLVSSNPSKIAVQATTTVAPGTMSKDVFLTTYPTLANASAIITATTGAISKTVFVVDFTPVLQDAVLTTTSLKGGQSTTMTLTLGSKAPSLFYVKLLSGAQSIVPLPNSGLVPAGTTGVGVLVPTNVVTTSLDITLVAYHGPDVRVMTLTVHP